MSTGPWQKHFSKKNQRFYYFNVRDQCSLWVVESGEDGWGRGLIDPKHPERGEKFVNILTNRVFYSESDFLKYLESKSSYCLLLLFQSLELVPLQLHRPNLHVM